MKSQYWLGVSNSAEFSDANLANVWWCVPPSAVEGDRILFYSPRAASRARHGIFAEGVIISSASFGHCKNSYCSGYNFRGSRLFYVDIQIVERYEKKLTAKMMKEDSLLRLSNVVRKNFQATTFQLDEPIYGRMKTMLAQINPDSTSPSTTA